MSDELKGKAVEFIEQLHQDEHYVDARTMQNLSINYNNKRFSHLFERISNSALKGNYGIEINFYPNSYMYVDYAYRNAQEIITHLRHLNYKCFPKFNENKDVIKLKIKW